MVCVSRFFQRLTFVLAATIFAALGLGFALGEFGMFGVHAGSEQDGAYRQMHVYAEVLKRVQSDYVTDPNINTSPPAHFTASSSRSMPTPAI